MVLRSPTGAPLVDVENDSPREDLPPMLEDFANWVDSGSVRPFANEATMRASMAGLGPSSRQLATTRNNNTLWMWNGSDWMPLMALGGGAWTTFTPKFYNNNSTDGSTSEHILPGSFSSIGRYTMVGPRTMAWRMWMDFGVIAALTDNPGVFLWTIPRYHATGPHLGSAKVVHNGATYGATCQAFGNREGVGAQVAVVRSDGTNNGFYGRRAWGSGGVNDWTRGDSIVMEGTWEVGDAL